MSKNIDQVFIANPITTNLSTDLMYFGQSPYGPGNDAAMTYANFSAQFVLEASLGSGIQAWLTTPSSANLLAAMTTKTGTGNLVFATSPTLVTPTSLGVQQQALNMNSNLINNVSTPVASTDAVNKAYADNIAAGLNPIGAVYGASTANLTSYTYNNGVAGVGATLTAPGNGVFTQDGVSPPVGSRWLYKNDTAASGVYNGIYDVTTSSAGSPAVLTRSSDYNQPNQIQPGDLISVENGTVNSGSSWYQTATVVTIGTSPITFSAFFSPATYLQKANNLSDVNNANTSFNNISPLTTKGDLIGFSTVNARFAVGSTNRQVLMVNSANATGLGWSTETYAAPGTAGNIFTSDGTNWTSAPPASLNLAQSAEGRLTLTTGTPVTTSDVTAATTLYFTPYTGNYISLFDGTSVWNTISFSELSIAVPATTNTMYDVFCYNNSGTATLELLAWTNDTTRATSIVLQNGRYVKSGVTTRLYVGSFRTTGTSGQTEDSLAKRYVWNYFNRVSRQMKVLESTSSWTYSTATIRQARATATNQLDMVIGVSEDIVQAIVIGAVSTITTSFNDLPVGVGLDSTTAFAGNQVFGGSAVASGVIQYPAAYYNAFISAGRHTLVWLEDGGGSGTQTWYGTNGGSIQQSGISGFLRG